MKVQINKTDYSRKEQDSAAAHESLEVDDMQAATNVQASDDKAVYKKKRTMGVKKNKQKRICGKRGALKKCRMMLMQSSVNGKFEVKESTTRSRRCEEVETDCAVKDLER